MYLWTKETHTNTNTHKHKHTHTYKKHTFSHKSANKSSLTDKHVKILTLTNSHETYVYFDHSPTFSQSLEISLTTSLFSTHIFMAFEGH